MVSDFDAVDFNGLGMVQATKKHKKDSKNIVLLIKKAFGTFY